MTLTPSANGKGYVTEDTCAACGKTFRVNLQSSTRRCKECIAAKIPIKRRPNPTYKR